MDIRKRFFTEGVVGHWNGLHRDVITAPNLSELKKHLDNALGHIVSFLGVPVLCHELDPCGSLPTHNILLFCDNELPDCGQTLQELCHPPA